MSCSFSNVNILYTVVIIHDEHGDPMYGPDEYRHEDISVWSLANYFNISAECIAAMNSQYWSPTNHQYFPRKIREAIIT